MMPYLYNKLTIALTAICLLVGSAFFAAAEPSSEEIEFAGKKLMFADDGEGQQTISLEGEELVKNYFVGVETQAEINEIPVAILYSSDGGNSCGPELLVIWLDDEGKIEKAPFATDCESPTIAVSTDRIYFIPYVTPGEEEAVKIWSPGGSFLTLGNLKFAPEAGTSWETFIAEDVTHPLDFFSNEAIYNTASTLLGDDLKIFASGLGSASPPQVKDGVFVGSGCLPHACGDIDALIVVDTNTKSLFLAQQSEDDYKFWPAKDTWPEFALAAFDGFKVIKPQ